MKPGLFRIFFFFFYKFTEASYYANILTKILPISKQMSWTGFLYFPHWKTIKECDFLDLKPGMFLLAVMYSSKHVFIFWFFVAVNSLHLCDTLSYIQYISIKEQRYVNIRHTIMSLLCFCWQHHAYIFNLSRLLTYKNKCIFRRKKIQKLQIAIVVN